MPVTFKTTKIAQRAAEDPLLYEILRDMGISGTDMAAAINAAADRLAAVEGVLAGWDGNWRIFNVRAYGATGDGTTDDTAAIRDTIGAAAATTPRSIVFFPPGIYRTTGGYDLNGLDGLQIVGSGVNATTIRLAHASNDLFSIGATPTSNLAIRHMKITSDTVTRTGGWVFHVNNAYNGTGILLKSIFEGLEVQKQVNGFGIKKYEFVALNDILIWDGVGTTGYALRFGQATASNVNQGSEVRCRNVQIYGNDLAGGTARFAAGCIIEDCDAVEFEGCGVGAIAGTGLLIVANAGGHGPSNHFLYGAILDATDTGHCMHVSGGGAVNNLKISATWFASAGQMVGTSNGNGLRIDVTTMGTCEITGCNFYNTRGTGLYVSTASAPIVATGNTFAACGQGAAASNNDAIYVSTSLDQLGPVFTGNQDTGSNGVSIRTGANANRLVLVGNRWVSGTSYGIAPNVDASNGT